VATDSELEERTSPRIVGLGASAGGLAALEQFLANVSPSSGLAYIVVQHLDPTHKALLTELLQRVTKIPVREAKAAAQVEPDVVYVIPPNTELTVIGGRLHLSEPAQPRGLRLPIDVLFSSLARDQGERAIGVVLSGMGADGTLGLQAIKSQGGLTLAQQPASAQFDSMPRSAIEAGACDIVAPASELPHRILLVSSAPAGAAKLAAGVEQDNERSLAVILALLREHSKHDLTLYKTSTLMRRIERRMGIHGLDTPDAYASFVQQNPKELDLLFKEMLIGVTSFFRDPAVWQELRSSVLPGILARSKTAKALRAWVVGCSTGEEAYSLAIAFREVAEAQATPSVWTLQIFATDLSADAVAFARNGRYSAKIANDMTPERLGRFFKADGDGYLVDKDVRNTVLFAQHDVTLDPPFTRLDILSCRNLMIYFNPVLQHRLLPLFHYVLRPGGVLVLGESESVGRSSGLFTPLDPKSRLYLRNDGAGAAGSVDFPVNSATAWRPSAQELAVSKPVSRLPNLQSSADQVLLQEFAPPAVLVTELGDIVYISGSTGRYLEPAAGKANWNIHVMARPEIRTQLAAGLRQAVQEKKTIELHGLKLAQDTPFTLDVSIRAILEPHALEGTAMIVFRDVPVLAASKSRRKRTAELVDPALRDEFARARDEIRVLRQEMRASQEELQSANEELQSTNEELQSANEELTTSKEESQSMNEELQAINAELHSKLADLALAQSDMQNLLNSTDIATLFLDNALNVRRFTDHISHIVHLREADIGRPLSELASTLIYPQLQADAQETLRTLVFCEKQIETTNGKWFAVRIMPYRTVSNVIQGVVITFVDITAAKALELHLRKT
jgi:two-component system, chemotaxis family, CheB/CheR fusion protein